MGRVATMMMGLVALASGLSTAEAGQPPSAPQLRIEAGMHTAMIRRIAVDAQERYLVTASDDKTARVWDLGSGELLRVLRPPIGAGNEGKFYAVAISPDGEMVAVAGWTGWDWFGKVFIYLFDRASGELIRRVGGLPNVVNDLAWSLDGRHLAAVLGAGNGLRVFDTSDWSEVARDSDYGSRSYWVDFDDQGRLLTTCWDGYLRLYDPGFKLIAKAKAPGGNEPFSARFSPDGKRIAVGFGDSTAVTILSATDLSLIHRVYTKGLDGGSLSTVAWSRDGDTLYAAGTYDDGSGENPILAWGQGGKGGRRPLPGSQTTVMDLRALKGGGLVFGSADPAFGVIDAQGQRGLARWPATLDFRDRHRELRVDQDATLVEFGFNVTGPDGNREHHRARVDLRAGRLQIDPKGLEAPSLRRVQQALAERGLDPGPADGVMGPRTREAIRAYQRQQGLKPSGRPGPALHRALGLSTLTPPRPAAPRLEVSGWYGSTDPKLNDKPLALKQYETAESLAISPDAQGLLLGTNFWLRLFDPQGRQRWVVPIPGTTWAVNISGDGRHAVAAFADGTLRWYRVADGREELALFLHPDLKRWVLWTPEGFYDASDQGAELIGYHLNHGPDQAGTLIAVEQMQPLFYRPDLVASRLSEQGEALARAELARIGDAGEVLAAGLPPTLELLSPTGGSQAGRDYTLHYRIDDQGGGIGRVEYRVNGVTVGDPQARPVGLGIPGQRRPFTLSPGPNTIEALVYNKKGSLASKPLRVEVEVREQARGRPALYGLAIGVTDYRDPALKLKYAAADAEAIANTLERQGRHLFSKVEIDTLVDREVTEAALGRAFADLAKKAGEDDVFVLYLAGHGMAIDAEYRFILPATRYSNQAALVAGSIGAAKLQQWLASIPARKSVMLLDTCQAGAFSSTLPDIGGRLLALRSGDLGAKAAIDRLMRATGRATLAATNERQFALAGHDGHGVFTWALLRGLEGAASRDGDQQVDIDELAGYVDREVPRITLEKWGYEQFPMFQMRGNAFPLSLDQAGR